MDDSQDSDEVVPNMVETNVKVAANKSGNDMRVKGDNRKQLQQGLQNVAQLANKGGAGGSSLANAKIKHGPKVVVSDSANTCHDVHNPDKILAPKHVMADPMRKQNLESIVIDEMSTPSIVEPTQSQPNLCINLDQDDDMIGIGVNGAAREKDTSLMEDFMNVELASQDDLVLFGEASTEQLDVMMGVLNSFCDASGEKISLAKSKILVSSNIDHGRAMDLSSYCGIPLTDDFGKYLGAPMIQGRVTKATYNALVSRAQSRLLG
ncbi:hypothetical protein COLO4_35642 [Corchorus olitorius]|uniref:Reverse transcriptase n=1 Tax=Corchorus olitorius TaxID=93759 RepID=A0A1R3GEF9_9ROSI|nr:hypothetical protein COLO4_35642 [Corchorus olitorius]